MENTQKKDLINTIIDFGIKHGMFKETDNRCVLELSIYSQLQEESFIENLIITITNRVRGRSDINVEELIYIIANLEAIRLKLEFKDYVT